MDRLIDIGFRKVGEWEIIGENINPNLSELADSSNILYVFIYDGEALYVGKTTQTLQKRLYGYKKPGPTQFTNIKGNKFLKELLKEGKAVDIYSLPDNGLHRFGVFHLNLAAGLEISIIKTLKPKWNGSLMSANQALQRIMCPWHAPAELFVEPVE